jgi:hypothetical protein
MTQRSFAYHERRLVLSLLSRPSKSLPTLRASARADDETRAAVRRFFENKGPGCPGHWESRAC